MNLNAGKARRTYDFTQANCDQYDIRTMCRLLEITQTDYRA